MDKKKILHYVIIFLLVYVTMSFFFKPPTENQSAPTQNFEIETIKKEFPQQEIVTVNIKNNTEQPVTVKNDCPREPLTVKQKIGNNWEEITNTAEVKCEQTEDYTIEPDKELNIRYDSWNHALFGEQGTYKIFADIEVPSEPSKNTTIESNEFEVVPQGWFGYIWTVGFYQPIYNALMFLTSIVPGHDLGWAIILLTIIIRTILLIPSHKAMKSQRKIQELQPKLNKIKEKYKDNQEMIAKETMALWREHKVNPLGSCMPLLIQFPFLIAIFYVIQTGLDPNNTFLLYEPLKDFSLTSINSNFLGVLDLTKINSFVLPLIVGGLQFLQMKFAMMRNKRVKEKQGKKEEKKQKGSEMDMANKMMIYIMPVMIAVFTASVPAGVGLYWSSSTLYGIFQQIIVNRQVETENVKVRVVSKK